MLVTSFCATGRLTQDPIVFDNSDGSKVVIVKLACKTGRVDANGEPVTEFEDFRRFITKDAAGLGPFAHIHKGDLVGVSGTWRADKPYTDKGGNTVYPDGRKAWIDQIEFLEPKSVTDARRSQPQPNMVAAAPAAEPLPLGDFGSIDESGLTL